MDIEYVTDRFVRVQNWNTVDDLLRLRDELRAATPPRQTLFVLDDQDQASYQSSHATSDLWLTGHEDATEHSAIMTAWVRSQLVDATLELEHPLTRIDEVDIDLLGHLDDPAALFRVPLGCLVVESTDPSMAIAAMPNGYFHGDLTPAQNYLVAERLRSSFGLEIFGLGASFAAFCRVEVLDLPEAQAVVAAVRHLYNGMTDELADTWAAKTAGLRWFLLSYRGA